MPETPSPKFRASLDERVTSRSVDTSPYVELQTTTNFSFLRGASHPEEIVERAFELGYRAVAITDLHSLAGIVRAHAAAKKLGMRLIVGARINLYREIPPYEVSQEDLAIPIIEREQPEYFLPLSVLLFPENKTAYGSLCRLLTKGKLRAPKGCCYLTLEDLKDLDCGVLAAAVAGHLSSPELKPALAALQELFSKDRLSLVLSKTYSAEGSRSEKRLNELSAELSVPLVISNDVLYHLPERQPLQDVLTCIRLGLSLEQAGFALQPNAERHLKSPAEMTRLFTRYPQALARAQQIGERALSFSLDQLKYQYPNEICPEGKDPMTYLTELSRHAAKERYPQGIPPAVEAQINYELKLIEELNYPQYFLTVYDIVVFARSRGILCQGRGAAANSAVCYCLGITSVDPHQIKLLFERFISRERNEPPDIDIDFEHERREEVLQYVYQKFGRHRAALVSEVITYRTRSAFKDVGKACGLSLDTIALLVKLFRNNEDRAVTREDLSQLGLDVEDPAVKHTVRLVQQILGFPRHLSQHVGGFVICEDPLCEIVPIENARMEDRTIIEWDKDDIDTMGMLKIDLLGLGMLTCIRKTFDLVNGYYAEKLGLNGRPLQLHTVPPEDPAVYEMASRADTIGVFQIESRAQMSMLPRLRPACFYDLVVEVAIVRPGPIQGGMIHPYLRRRAGLEPVSYPDERIKGVLERTLGVPIFQEQVMELAVVAAGFTPGEAEALRRAMAAWRKNKLLLGYEVRLIEGMRKRGYTHDFAVQCFEQIKGFGEYGFPQSHAASFALLVYVSAWLKRYHPAFFAAALLNSQPMGFYQPAQIIQDAKNHGVEVRPIDVNYSFWDCTMESSTASLKKGLKPALRLGLRLIKGLHVEQAEKLASAVRDYGPFNSLTRLWRISGIKISALKVLARADAFLSMGMNRQEALWQISKLRDERLPLLEGYEGSEPACPLPGFTDLGHVLRDYSSTGFSLKAHPVSFIRPALEQEGIISAKELKRAAPSGMTVSVAGLVLVRQRPSTASGTVFITIEDETGPMNLVVWPKTFNKLRSELCDSALIAVEGKVERQAEILHVIVDDAKDLSYLLSGTPPDISRNFH